MSTVMKTFGKLYDAYASYQNAYFAFAPIVVRLLRYTTILSFVDENIWNVLVCISGITYMAASAKAFVEQKRGAMTWKYLCVYVCVYLSVYLCGYGAAFLFLSLVKYYTSYFTYKVVLCMFTVVIHVYLFWYEKRFHPV